MISDSLEDFTTDDSYQLVPRKDSNSSSPEPAHADGCATREKAIVDLDENVQISEEAQALVEDRSSGKSETVEASLGKLGLLSIALLNRRRSSGSGSGSGSGSVSSGSQNQHQCQSQPWTQDQLNKLKRIELKSPDQASKYERCEVCLVAFVPYNTIIRLPCKHNFHEECLLPRLTKNSYCPVPMCNTDLTKVTMTDSKPLSPIKLLGRFFGKD